MTIPKIIYSYWHKKSEAPEIVNLCWNQMKKYNPSWDVQIYDESMIPRGWKVPKGFSKLKKCHQSDWIRLKLLEKTGGVWIDSSIMTNVPLEFIFDFTFNGIQGYNVPWSFENVLENWLIIAPSNSLFVKIWLSHFENAISMGFEKYKETIDKHFQEKYAELYKRTPYLTQHMCFTKAKKDLPDYPIKLQDSCSGPFKIQCSTNWDPVSFVLKITNELHDHPIIKIRGGSREVVTTLSKLGFNIRETLLGKTPLLLPSILGTIVLFLLIFFLTDMSLG